MIFTQIQGQTPNNLDLMGSTGTSAQVAYGLRKLSSTYAGNAIRVRRASDNLEADVAFGGTSPYLISGSSQVTVKHGVTVGASLGTTGTGTLNTVQAKTGTLAITVNKTGTITVAVGTTAVTGSGTSFLTELAVGDVLYKTDNTLLGVVKSIQSNTALTLNNGSIANITSVSYRTQLASVTGSGTNFTDLTNGFQTGDKVFKTDHTYLGTVASVASATVMYLNSRDAVVYSGNFEGTSATVTGTSTSFTSGDIGKILISKNNIVLGVIGSYTDASTVTLTTKAGDAITSGTNNFRILASLANFEAFYSGTNVFVVTWYDQSGYGRDLMQSSATSNQPKIASTGALYTVNDRPSIQFSSTLSSFLRTTSTASWLLNTLYTLNCVSAEATAAVPAGTYSFLLSTTGYGGPTNTILHYGYRTPSQYTLAQYSADVNFTTQASTDLELHTAVKTNLTSVQFYKNGVSLGTVSNSGQTHLKDLGLFNIGLYTPVTGYFSGSLSELALFSQSLSSSDRASMDNNQLSYFNIQSANWTGAANTTDWNTAGNWSPAVVPSAASPSMVIIPAGCSYYPVISGTSAGKNIVIQSGGSVSVPLGGKLQISGSLNNSGTFTATYGTIEMAGTTQQMLGLSSPIANLIINNAAGVSLSSSITVSENITFTSGYISIGGLALTIGGTVTNTVSGGLWGSTNSSIIISGSPTLSFSQSGTNNTLKNLTINGSGAVATLASNLIMNNNGTLIFTNGKLSIGSNTLTIRGAVTNTVSGGLRGGSSSNVVVDGALSPTLSVDQTTPGTTNLLNNFTVATTSSNTVGISGNLEVNGTLTINSGQTLNMGTYALGGTLTTIANSGTINTQHTGTSPFPSGKSWGGTIVYNSASTAQTAVSGIYNNLTISTTGGAMAGGNITVNGVLSLASNPSATKGCLEMVSDYSNYPGTTNANPGYNNMTSYYLKMGASATTTGTGDVTGIVKRTTILANTAYSFGNAYTTVMLSSGTMPDSLTVTIKIGAVPPNINTTTSVKRHWEIVPLVADPETFTSTSRLSINFHYLDSELNENTEPKLTTWDYDIDGGATTPDEHGRASYDFTNNYIGLTNVPISYFIKKSDHVWRTIFYLGDYQVGYKIWNGSQSTNWHTEANWTPSGAPGVGNFVIIPDVATTSNRSPVLPESVTINTMTIEEGGILVMGSSVITIQNSLSAGWEDRSGLSDPGTSTVVFSRSGATVSGKPRFYDVRIDDGADLTVAAGTTMKIGNDLLRYGSGIFYAGIYNSTVEYSKAGDQLVELTDASPHYSGLTLSGSGIKTLPVSPMTISGAFSLAGSVVVAPSHALTVGGNVEIGTGTSFTGGNLTHNMAGDFINNGTFDGSGATLNMNGTAAQQISGSSATSVANLTVDNPSGVYFNSNETTTVSGTLLINAGRSAVINEGKKLTVSGSFTNNAGESGFVIKSGSSGTGSLLFDGNVNGRVERYIPNDLKWHFLSSPITTQPIWPGFAPSPTENNGIYTFTQQPYNWDFYYWNPNASTSNELYWVNLRKNSNGDYNDNEVDAVGSEAGFGATVPPTFIAGRGYLSAYGAEWDPVTGSPVTHTFSGSINGGNRSLGVTRGANVFNLVGNPYPSAIDWKASTGWDRTNLATNTGGGYDYWVFVDAEGNYGVFNSSGSSGTHGISREIAPMQAFFVMAASTGNVAVGNNTRVHSSQTWLKEETSLQNVLIFKLFSQATPYHDEMNIEAGVDQNSGSMKFWSMYSTAPEIWSAGQGSARSIERLSSIDDQTTIVIGIKPGVGGICTLRAEGIPLFSFAKSVILEDLKTGAVRNLSVDPVYEFFSYPTDLSERFHLHFGGPYGVEDTRNQHSSRIWVSDRTLFVSATQREYSQGDVYLFNMSGQLCMHKRIGSGFTTIPLTVPAGCYVAALVTSGMKISQKVFVH